MPSGFLSTVALNARPLGSCPMCRCTACSPCSSVAMQYVSGLEEDCTQKGMEASPCVKRCPCTVHTARPY